MPLTPGRSMPKRSPFMPARVLEVSRGPVAFWSTLKTPSGGLNLLWLLPHLARMPMFGDEFHRAFIAAEDRRPSIAPERSKVLDIELSSPLAAITGLDGYATLQGLVRLHGTPIGYVRLPVAGGRCTKEALHDAIRAQLPAPLASRGPSDAGRTDAGPPAVADGTLPVVTVAVCTRDRPDDLARCLDALGRLRYPRLDLLVVDNAPASDATERQVRETYPAVRYVREPRPGLDWARNRAIREARGEIVAYTDDDVIVDPGWVSALVRPFAADPAVMAVTGLVVPCELETAPQMLFERYGGFGRGFERKRFQVRAGVAGGWVSYHGAGQFGTGANMAYRRSVFARIGDFDPALDVGTVTNGGGDLEMFFRVLKEGHALVYEPSALVRHRHRREYAQLRAQLTNNGIGFYAYLARTALAYPDERLACLRLGLWWLWWWNIRRLLISLVRPGRYPRDLILAELRGSLVGPGRYLRARRTAARIARSSCQVATRTPLPADIPVSVVVATRDRPADLRNCLRSLAAVESPRRVEIIVVDNNAASGLTPAIVGEFPGTVLVDEARQGLSYARNRGITASTGAIVATVDDDVTVPPGWLERLVAPFACPAVMAVTGNVLPLELATPAQRIFEGYGGLGRGDRPRAFDGEWFASFRFRAVPTWSLGGTANAAFRATIFGDARIGLLDEALGAGTPTGCSEDTYLFYKVLKAGHTLVYEPAAHVWHKHRRDLPALRRQIYNYSKGHVAYHLMTLIRDRDLRSLVRLAIHLPAWRAMQVAQQIVGFLGGRRPTYPFSLVALEIAGNVVGGWALWRAHRRVVRAGRSAPYVLVERAPGARSARTRTAARS